MTLHINQQGRMTKFRKKPIIIEAFQMTKSNVEFNKESSWPLWLFEAWNKGTLFITSMSQRSDELNLSIWTLGGPIRVDWDDWIIKGVMGELYLCTSDIFELTYEAV